MNQAGFRYNGTTVDEVNIDKEKRLLENSHRSPKTTPKEEEFHMPKVTVRIPKVNDKETSKQKGKKFKFILRDT